MSFVSEGAKLDRRLGRVARVSVETATTEEYREGERIVLTEAQKRAQRSRSIAIALALGALVILFYVMTLVKGPGVLVGPI